MVIHCRQGPARVQHTPGTLRPTPQTPRVPLRGRSAAAYSASPLRSFCEMNSLALLTFAWSK
jgi:hypothetical protein